MNDIVVTTLPILALFVIVILAIIIYFFCF